MKSVIRLKALVILLIVQCVAYGAEWGRFRGPNGTGAITGKTLPVEFDESSSNWSVVVPGKGNSSPVIGGENVYLTSAIVDKESKRGARTLHAFALEDGKLQWSVAAAFATYKTNNRNGFASSSVCADENGVYVFWQAEQGSSLTAYDHDGELRWNYDVGKFGAGTGAGTSPVVHKGVILLSHDNEKFESFLLAVNASNGKRKWHVVRKTQRTGYATPVIFEPSSGETQVVFSHSYEGMVGVSFETGEIIWQNVVFGEHNQRAVGSPIVIGDQVIAASGFTNGIRTLVSVKPDYVSDSHEAQLHFKTTRNVPHCPTPLALDGKLYCWTDRGILACLDLSDGSQKWLTRVGGEFFASPIAVNDRILAIDRNGTMVVITGGDQYKELGRSELEDGVMATPALTKDAVFVRTENRLIRFDLSSE